MEGFVVNFDLFGGLSMDQWLEEEEKKEQKKERYARVTNEELDKLERSRNEETTSVINLFTLLL